MPQDADPKDQARFVFQGTVQQLNAVTMRSIAAAANTITVKVDHVVRGPDVCNDFVGREITLYTNGGPAFALSQSGMFYTNVATFGDGLAVRLLAFEELRPGSAGQAALAAHEDPGEALRRHHIAQRVDSADLVISGRITAVRLVDEEDGAAAGTARAAAASPASSRAAPVSEHAPLWQEAEVQVDSVLKGTHDGAIARIRFPASTDVRWYRAPKLTPGREGVFILHTGEAERAAKGMLAAAGAAAPPGAEPVFTALNPDDFQPTEEFERIQHVASTTRGR
jgi:hypothetical protein